VAQNISVPNVQRPNVENMVVGMYVGARFSSSISSSPPNLSTIQDMPTREILKFIKASKVVENLLLQIQIEVLPSDRGTNKYGDRL
jgi:hypothetical protein